MEIPLPLTFNEIADEIARFTTLPRPEVEERLWHEALMTGFNVVQQAKRLEVTPNRYDERMERLYREGDGFIFETMAFWSSPMRLCWIQQALGRIQQHAATLAVPLAALKVLIFGDGSGNDSLYLASNGLAIDYFDIPGSKTFDFACDRFDHYGVRDGAVRVITDLASCTASQYDVVLSFEVLEHLTDPITAIRDLAGALKPGGLALITESFGVVSLNLPTHLESNRKLDGKTPFLFAKEGLELTWYSELTLFKPYEFTKTGRRGTSKLWQDKRIRDKYLVTAFGTSAR